VGKVDAVQVTREELLYRGEGGRGTGDKARFLYRGEGGRGTGDKARFLYRD